VGAHDAGRQYGDHGDIAKRRLRGQVRDERRSRPEAERSRDQSAIGQAVLRWCRDNLAPAAVIAGYEPFASEPLPATSAAGLTAAGFAVIVPVTQADNDLEWRGWVPEGELAGPTLGLDAIRSAALILVPAFAVDAEGRRLGRGGGSYDRALARVQPGTITLAVVFGSELIAEVPVQAWDRRVNSVVTPAGVQRLVR
jgi:5-formyltetrahydrofolate cyclo-ligase